jgi:hypothetical protein
MSFGEDSDKIGGGSCTRVPLDYLSHFEQLDDGGVL